jgi:hypothetical protein
VGFETVAELVALFGLAAVDLLLAIPLGIAIDIAPPVVGVVCAAGGALGVGLFVIGGGQLRERVRARRAAGGRAPRDPGRRSARLRRLYDRYGVPGVGLMAPPLTTAPGGVLLGLALGAPRDRLRVWGVAGILLWSVVGTALAAAGASLVR